jgi:hypothetical protein
MYTAMCKRNVLNMLVKMKGMSEEQAKGYVREHLTISVSSVS